MAEDAEAIETPEIEGLDKMVLPILVLYLRSALWLQKVNGACPLPPGLATNPLNPKSLEKRRAPLSSSLSRPAALGGHLRHK